MIDKPFLKFDQIKDIDYIHISGFGPLIRDPYLK